MSDGKQIRLLDSEGLQEGLALVWEVFSQHLALQATDEGIEEFWHTIDFEYLLHRMGDGTLRFWGAFEGEHLVGLIALRELTHITLLFVESDHQFQGAGTALLKKALLDCKALDPSISRVTVEALGDSRGFFEALGFRITGDDYMSDGIIKTPMEIAHNSDTGS